MFFPSVMMWFNYPSLRHAVKNKIFIITWGNRYNLPLLSRTRFSKILRVADEHSSTAFSYYSIFYKYKTRTEFFWLQSAIYAYCRKSCLFSNKNLPILSILKICLILSEKNAGKIFESSSNSPKKLRILLINGFWQATTKIFVSNVYAKKQSNFLSVFSSLSTAISIHHFLAFR